MSPRPRRVLIVAPHFPPVNAADAQRVRMALPYLAEAGWEARVLAVEPSRVEGVFDPRLAEALPEEVPVTRVGALPARWTRRVGLGAIALRAAPWLDRAARRLAREERFDLAFFSTAQFPAMALGRVWRRRHGWPYVLDVQDPWVTGRAAPAAGRRGIKHRLMDGLHARLEPWTMARAGGIVAVSPDYLDALRARYPRLEDRPGLVLPFGASEADFEALGASPAPNPAFDPEDGAVHGVYVGRGGADMARAASIAFRALAAGLEAEPDRFDPVRLHFVGTDYAPAGRGVPSIRPVAERHGVADRVDERPARVPYFEALRLLSDADFLLVPGSDDPAYTASKIYPYVLARRPLLAVFHERSTVVDVLRETGGGEVVTFGSGGDDAVVDALRARWSETLARLPFEPDLDAAAFAPYTARDTTRRLAALFDAVVEAGP